MGPIELKWQKVLLVDDEPAIRRLVRRLLEQFDMEVTAEASDGEEAIGCILKEQPQFVLCDIMMEPMDGLSFLKTVRTGGEGLPRDLKVLIFSSLTENPHYATALALDADAFLSKPFGREELAEKLVRCLQEPVSIGPVEQYKDIPIPEPVIGGNLPGAPTGPISGVEVPIGELVEGDVLAMDLGQQDGTILLTAGMELTASLLARLNDLAGIGVIRTAYIREQE